jgi:hypothetical protein
MSEDYSKDDFEEYDYEFELLNSDDERIITLACRSSKILSPTEYAEAIRAYADRIESILHMSELRAEGMLN